MPWSGFAGRYTPRVLPLSTSINLNIETPPLSKNSGDDQPEVSQDLGSRRRCGLRGVVARFFPVLESRDYELLWVGQIFAASAMWMEQVARNRITWEMTGSALQLGAVNFVRVIPAVFAGMLAGVMADRVSKKKLLMIAQLWSLVVYTLMSSVVLSGNLELWHLYVSTMALSLGQSIREPVRAAYAPALVPPHHLVGALSLNATAMNGSRVLWPAVTGLLISAINPGYAYLTAVGFYLVVQTVTMMIKNPDAPDERPEVGTIGGDLLDGFRFVFGSRALSGLLFSRFGPITVASGFQVLIPVFAVQVLGMGAGAYGLLLSAEGLGAIIGGFTLASRRDIKRPGMIAFVGGTLVSALLMLGYFMTTFWGLWALLLCVGIAQVAFNSSNNAAMFAHTPSNMRGRMVGVRNQTRSLVPVAHLGAGALAETAGAPVVFAVIGVLSLAILWSVQAWRPETAKAG
jgi:MFS family permease